MVVELPAFDFDLGPIQAGGATLVGPCERAEREPFGHTRCLEPQPSGAVTRRAVAQRRSRASGLTRLSAAAIRGFGFGFVVPFSPVPPRFAVRILF